MFSTLTSFIPNPLHPAVVHLPVALAVLLPFFAFGALIAIRRQVRPRGVWGLTVALLLALSVSAWVAIETGEDQEERVERVVAEAPLEAHEDAADTFLWLSVGLLAVAGVGLVSGRIGASARLVASVGSVALLVAGYRVGHSGGELVYTHGAASAYVSGSGGSLSGARSAAKSAADAGANTAAGAATDDDDRR